MLFLVFCKVRTGCFPASQDHDDKEKREERRDNRQQRRQKAGPKRPPGVPK